MNINKTTTIITKTKQEDEIKHAGDSQQESEEKQQQDKTQQQQEGKQQQDKMQQQQEEKSPTLGVMIPRRRSPKRPIPVNADDESTYEDASPSDRLKAMAKRKIKGIKRNLKGDEVLSGSESGQRVTSKSPSVSSLDAVDSDSSNATNNMQKGYISYKKEDRRSNAQTQKLEDNCERPPSSSQRNTGLKEIKIMVSPLPTSRRTENIPSSSEGPTTSTMALETDRKRGRPPTTGEYISRAEAKQALIAAQREEQDFRIQIAAESLLKGNRILNNREEGIGMESVTTAELTASVESALNSLTTVSKLSKGLKGTTQKIIKEAVCLIRTNAEEFSKRSSMVALGYGQTTMEENLVLAERIRKIKAENESLKKELNALKNKTTTTHPEEMDWESREQRTLRVRNRTTIRKRVGLFDSSEDDQEESKKSKVVHNNGGKNNSNKPMGEEELMNKLIKMMDDRFTNLKNELVVLLNGQNCQAERKDKISKEDKEEYLPYRMDVEHSPAWNENPAMEIDASEKNKKEIRKGKIKSKPTIIQDIKLEANEKIPKGKFKGLRYKKEQEPAGMEFEIEENIREKEDQGREKEVQEWTLVQGKRKQKIMDKPTQEESKQTEGRRSYSEAAKVTTETGRKNKDQKDAKPTPSIKPLLRKLPNTEAVTIICPNDTYAEILEFARAKINLEDIGITNGIRQRTTRSGATSLIVTGADREKKMQRL